MALLANCHRDPLKQPTPYEGKDFIPMSYDEITNEIKVTGVMMFELLSERFKNKPLRSG